MHLDGMYSEALPSRQRAMRNAMSGEDYADEMPTGPEARLLKRQDDAKRLHDLFGYPIYMNVTELPQTNGKPSLPALLGGEGRHLSWTLWSPHRRVLIDVFKREPSRSEMSQRAEYARQHELRYAVVQPGWSVTFDDIRSWLGKSDGALTAPQSAA